MPRSFRARLALSISAVVAFALILVLAVLPRLLDGYFNEQETQNLQARGVAVGQLLYETIVLSERGGLVPIVEPGSPPRLSDQMLAALTASDETETPFLTGLARFVAQADLTVAVYDGATPSGTPIQPALHANTTNPGGGQTRETGSVTSSFVVRDAFWSQFSGTAPSRAVVYTLSSPYTLHDRTLENVITVLIAVAVLALTLAVIVAYLVADRVTGPIRKLTMASRSLEEGDLSARANVSSSSAPEVVELATTFNRMAEQLESTMAFIRRDRDRSRDFLADVSHELRTPIAALRMFNELLQDGAGDDPATRAEFLQTSQVQIERLDFLAENLLELSRLDSGLIALDLRPDDLRSAVESAIEQAEPTAKRKGVTLTAEMPDGPIRQPHDPQRLGQVLTNLVGNAVKFTPSGGRVTVSLAGTRDGARITVRDTGVGIDPDELPHVFERFYRGSSANEARASGSGLGLSIARSIIEMHGGRISIASRPGQGTQVDVFLPRAVSAPGEMMESSPSAALPLNSPVPE